MAIGDQAMKKKFLISEIITKQIDDIKNFKFLDAKTHQQIAEIAADVIRDRTRRGIGCDGKGNAIKFKGYAQGTKGTIDYAKKRANEGLPTAPVDLTVTGKLLDGIHPVQLFSNGSVTLAVNEEDRGNARGAQEGIKRNDLGLLKRPFMGMTEADKKRFMERAVPLIRRAFAKYQKEQKLSKA